MNKEEFLSKLRTNLSGLPQEDIEERISFYSEMIDDRMEDGVSEEDAVAGIGSVEQICEQIMSEIPLSKLVKEKVKPKRKLKAWEIVLLVLGSPIWIPLIIAAIAIALSLYVLIWAIVICIYAADLSLLGGAIAGVAGIFVYLKSGNIPGAVFILGAGFICAGLAILLFFACLAITGGVIKLTGKILTGIKTAFVGKEA